MARLSKQTPAIDVVQAETDKPLMDHQPVIKTEDDWFGDDPEAEDVTPKGEKRSALHFDKQAVDFYSGDWIWRFSRWEGKGTVPKLMELLPESHTGYSLTKKTQSKRSFFVFEPSTLYPNTRDNRDPVPFGALSDICALDGEQMQGANSGYDILSFESHPEMQTALDKRMFAPRRSLVNLDKESRSRGGLRAKARTDPYALLADMPADIIERLTLPHGDDVPLWLPIRHPCLAPSWDYEPQLAEQDPFCDVAPTDWSGRAGQLFPVPLVVKAKADQCFIGPIKPCNVPFTAAPRRRFHTTSPGLVVGDVECKVASVSQTVNIHGVRIGLLKRERPDPEPVKIIYGTLKKSQLEWEVTYDVITREPARTYSGKGRSVTDPFQQMAVCAAKGTVPKFLSGISLPMFAIAPKAPAPLAASSDTFALADPPALTSRPLKKGLVWL